jgi:signal transduction histidine kinase
MSSLRARLIIGTGVTTALLVGAASASLFFLVRSTLYGEFDQLLSAKARALAALIEQDADKVEIEFAEHPLQEFERADRPEYFQVWADDGRVLARSRRLEEHDLDRINGEAGEPEFRFVRLPDGRDGRLASVWFYPSSSGKGEEETRSRVTLSLARETAPIDATLAKLTWILAAVGFATTLLILAALAWVIHRSLKPVARLARDIDSINEGQLDVCLDLDDAPDELLPVVKRLNSLLARLHAAFEREKSFTSDAAHELRTPLAGLRSTLEVSLSRQRSTEAYRQAMEKCLAICQRTQSIVETLLTLARLDGAARTGSTGTIHVAGVLRDCWNTCSEKARQRKLDVRWQVDESFQLQTDGAGFPIMIDNLFANAVAHTNEGGFVRIESSLHDGEMAIHITNSGSQIDAEQVDHVFEAFWQGDTARSATGIHAGLGLALCKRLADSLGCRISAASTKGGDFSVCLGFSGQFIPQTGRQQNDLMAD